jgi:uncharacterized iron-regulated membrane protein
MMIRTILVRLHRWVGLATAAFLVMVGLTGALLAFLPELNHALTPSVFSDHQDANASANFALLAQRAEALVPAGQVSSIDLTTPGVAAIMMEPRLPKEGIDVATLYLDATSATELGRVRVGTWPATLAQVTPFVYNLHTQLLSGESGGWILGLVALLWTFDCSVAFFLTLPRPGVGHARSFLSRWSRAWRIRAGVAPFRVNFDLHRASGLWLWIALLVFAWSGVYMNLNSVYSVVTNLLFGYQQPVWARPLPPSMQQRQTRLTWAEAEVAAQRLMENEAGKTGFAVVRPIAFYAMRDRGLFEYTVRSTLDIGDRGGRTTIDFDAASGALAAVSQPTGQLAGTTITTWLLELHMANIFGLPYRVFVSALGLTIVMLSGTGIYIWWRKLRARRWHRAARRSGGYFLTWDNPNKASVGDRS